jgi:NADPH:quinone reductase-like Zn-dependent oxidoreductase
MGEVHMSGSTMKAVQIHEYGGPDVLLYEDAPRPEGAKGDALVRVHAAGVNPVDWKIREGFLRQAIPYKLPMIPGWDVSGTVEAIGGGNGGLRVGDEVYARPDITRNGAYAEYMVVRVSELAKKPRSLGHVHAAAVPLAALTAWQALLEAPHPYTSANLKKGQTVLIHGAAGGVGSFAVQLAKWRGARVIATASGGNETFVYSLGADQFVDYTRQPFEEVVHGVDAVLDTIGGEVQLRSWKTLKPGGVLVSIAGRPSEELARAYGARAAYVFVQPSALQLTEIARLIDAKIVKPMLAEVLPLSQARRAHELSQGGHVRGKIVLNVVS